MHTLRPFEQQAVTLSRSGDAVKIKCEDVYDAEMVFDWLVDVQNCLAAATNGSTMAARSFDAMGRRVRCLAGPMIVAHFGERCPEFDATCVICRKWKQLDDLLESPYR